MEKTIIANHIAQVLSSEMTIKAFTEGLNNISFREMKEFFELHQELNTQDQYDSYEKECQMDADWLHYTRPLRVRRPRGLNTHQEMNYHLGIAYSWEEVWEQYKEAELERTREEIAEYESVLAKDDMYAWLNESDNDIAYETVREIEKANLKRKFELSKIASDAVTKRIYYATVLKFMQTMCKDDNERIFFLAEYANAQWRDGRNH